MSKYNNNSVVVTLNMFPTESDLKGFGLTYLDMEIIFENGTTITADEISNNSNGVNCVWFGGFAIPFEWFKIIEIKGEF